MRKLGVRNKASVHSSLTSLFSFLLALSSFLFCACPNPLVIKVLDPKTVSFETNGGSRIKSQTIYRDYPIKRPSNPSRGGYTFDAWYSDNETFVNKWNFDTIPTKDITLYANWVVIITTVVITVTGPVKGEPPDTAASGSGNFSIGEVSWSPDHNPFIGETQYTATVTLTANEGFTFIGLVTASINGQTAEVANNTGNTLTLSYTFEATSDREVTALAVKTQPAKLTYTHGDTLDLTGLVVTLSYDDGTTGDAAAENFTAKNITTNPAHGDYLVHLTHDGLPVTITYGSLTSITGNLTVNPRAVTLTVDPIPAQTYTGNAHTPAVTVRDGEILLALNTDYTAAYANNTNAGTAAVTITGADNYAGSAGSADFTINKAAGTAVAAPTAASVGVNSVTLTSAAEPATGQTVEYGMNTSNTAPTNGWQTSAAFNELTAVTAYYFFARSASNDNYETGAASAGTEITTKQQTGDDSIVNYWVDDTGEISIGTGAQPLLNNTVTIRDGGSVTFSAVGGGYSDHRWTLNGISVGAGVSYTFDTSGNDKEPNRNYIIGLRVRKDDKYYLTQITVRVEEE